jgi:phage tail-like protein
MRVQTAQLDTAKTLVSVARFVVAFDGTGTEISFSELAGITSEVAVADYTASGKGGVTLAKQFGLTKPATVTLKRGIDQDNALWEWHQEVLRGLPSAKRGCTLFLQDITGQNKQQYHLLNAWPSKLDIGGMKAGGGDAAIATVTLVCEQIDLEGTKYAP